jgi:N-carbamoyl-L-amino-acid hydrolase
MALGHVSFETMGKLVRFDTGRTLADYMAALGFAGGAPVLSPGNLACWLELHIEQGPLLIERDLPIGIATAIRGNIRHPQAKCFGAWAHSAAVPRAYRSDAVVALSDLIMRIDAFWSERIAQGDDNFVATIGQFSTHPDFHAMTKVAGEVSFTLNLGATQPETLAAAKRLVAEAIAEIQIERHVRFDIGRDVGTAPTPLDAGLVDMLEASATAQGLGSLRMPTVGHDAGMFAMAGVPAAMIMVRNQNGSHNPDEALEFPDYAAGVRVQTGAALKLAGIIPTALDVDP